MGKQLLLRKGKRLVKFDHQLNTDKGHVMAVKLVAREVMSEKALVTLGEGTAVEVNKLHKL